MFKQTRCRNILRLACQQGFSYLSFNTDAYSRKVVGYWLYPTLEAEQIAISMTRTGISYDNQQAERVNGIIKNEFSPNKIYRDHQEAEKEIVRIIDI